MNPDCAGSRLRRTDCHCNSHLSRSPSACGNTWNRGPAPGCSPRRRWPSVRIFRILPPGSACPRRARCASTVPSTIPRKPACFCRRACPSRWIRHSPMNSSDACAPLLLACGGRAFLLYTSYRGLAEGVRALKTRFPEPPFPVLVQGEAPREALLNRFRELGNAVLLATGSFWEGVDVKGEALSIVAIDKLPFAAPDDPLLKARLEGIRRRGGNPFYEYQLPQAVLALKQGVGRLIRDFDDFGVIVIGDPRISTKGYGRVFLDSMPREPHHHRQRGRRAVPRRARWAKRACFGARCGTPLSDPRAGGGRGNRGLLGRAAVRWRCAGPVNRGRQGPCAAAACHGHGVAGRGRSFLVACSMGSPRASDPVRSPG